MLFFYAFLFLFKKIITFVLDFSYELSEFGFYTTELPLRK